MAAATELEIDFDIIADSLSGFRGVNRRFEIKAVIDDIMVVDDYAHHPTEIIATLKTARSSYRRRVLVVFQPHLYSRTRQFYREFAEALMLADLCLLVDIYPAREEPIEGVTSELIARYAAERGYNGVRYIGPLEKARDEIVKIARPGDIIITIGAGSITRVNPEIVRGLKGDES